MLILRRIWVPLVLVLALSVAGCGGEESEESGLDEVFVEPTAEPDLLPTEEDLRDRFEGTVTDPFDLLVETCFNQYTYLDRNDLPAQLTTAIGCNRPHNGQVYAILIHNAPAGAPYPGEEAVNGWGQDQCLEQFEPFVGLEYVKSELEIGMIIPSRSDWEGEDNRRGISCFVHSWRGLLIVGTMKDIAL
ncbi:septum formation family protein [Candidatus Poriferisocius sp.]|uniref:septum formation family protein n=1 Tax=Candidatus Poriferisocius sp. TaxID=3101276 RepID=UPI003B017E0F